MIGGEIITASYIGKLLEKLKKTSEIDDLVLKGKNYSPEYINKLQETYKLFKKNGFEITEHGLNRLLGRINQGKIGTVDEVINALLNGTTYIDTANGGYVEFLDGISVHIADDGFIKTIIGNAKIKETWELFQEVLR